MENNRKNRLQKMELLAPAGSYETLRAVIEAGADAVYVGGPAFGARAYANNFTEEELLEAIDYAHMRRCRVYLTVNTLLKNNEIDKVQKYLEPFVKQGLDAVLVQDFGVLELIHSAFPDLEIHTSTQMTVTGPDGVRFLQQYGVSRVVMAREVSLDEMKRIHDETGMELEAFVHGAICYCYSGQCLFSSMLGGRSGNRGRCAQPCRLPYEVVDEDNKPVILKNQVSVSGKTNNSQMLRENSAKTKARGQIASGRKKTGKKIAATSTVSGYESYVISLKDMCGIEDLPALYHAGVYSLKIEGRMKSADYASGVVSIYRRYLDQLLAQEEKGTEDRENPAAASKANQKGLSVAAGKADQKGLSAEVSKADQKHLSDLGSRCGFTDGYYYKQNGRDMITFQKPNFEYRDPEYHEQMIENFVKQQKKLPVEGRVTLRTGEPSLFEVWNRNGIYACASGNEPMEAQKKPLTEEEVGQRMSKTGDTPFAFTGLEVILGENCFLPNGSLNQLRRDALNQLSEKILAPFRRNSDEVQRTDCDENRTKAADIDESQQKAAATDENRTKVADIDESQPKAAATDENRTKVADIDESQTKYLTSEISTKPLSRGVSALAETGMQLQLLLDWKPADWIYADTHIYTGNGKQKPERSLKEDLSRAHAASKKLFLALPQILRTRGERELLRFMESQQFEEPDGYLIRNYEEFYLVQKKYPQAVIVTDHNMYTYNNESICAFLKAGADMVTMPLELNAGEIAARENTQTEMIVYGRYPLMVSAQCVHANTCGCDQKPQIIRMKDRYHALFPVRNNCRECFNIIYNSVPVCFAASLDRLKKAEISRIRLQFTVEDADETRKTLILFAHALEGKIQKEELDSLGAVTYGHYRRGVE